MKTVVLLAVTWLLLSLVWAVDLPKAYAQASPKGADTPRLIYHLGAGSDQWPADKRQQLVTAMDAAVALYNQLGDFDKDLTVTYSPGTPTADGNYNGSLRFGGQIGKRVALHEIAHALGIGTHPNWESMAVNGRWTGPYAVAQLHALDGPNAVLYCDHQHFWPYGLNYESEDSRENERRHVLMVAAFRRDLGIIIPGQPIRGMVGVGTWATQAEFKDIQVTKGGQTLFRSDFSKGMSDWKTTRGRWQVVGGALQQTGTDEDTRAIVGDPSWSDYTLTLKARKLGGAEGFLVLFGSLGDDTKIWWNLGGWKNTQDGLEVPGVSSAPVPGHIETGRWYDIRVEVQGPTVKCYLDSQLVQQAAR